VRTCLGCGLKAERRELKRFYLTPELSVQFDSTGKGAGRGAYCCPNKKCLKAFFKAPKRLARAFRCKNIDGIIDPLEIEKLLGSGSFR